MFWIVVKIAAVVLTLVGTIFGIGGTYLMTMAYHPFTEIGFWKSLLHIGWLVFTGRYELAKNILKDAAVFSKVNEENRALSLGGIYILFVGFFVQTLGGLCAVIDVLHELSK